MEQIMRGSGSWSGGRADGIKADIANWSSPSYGKIWKSVRGAARRMAGVPGGSSSGGSSSGGSIMHQAAAASGGGSLGFGNGQDLSDYMNAGPLKTKPLDWKSIRKSKRSRKRKSKSRSRKRRSRSRKRKSKSRSRKRKSKSRRRKSRSRKRRSSSRRRRRK